MSSLQLKVAMVSHGCNSLGEHSFDLQYNKNVQSSDDKGYLGKILPNFLNRSARELTKNFDKTHVN